MRLFHGSDTLKKGKKPDPYFGEPHFNGAFFALTKDFAKEFGDTVHEFEIDDSCIFDLRLASHREMLHGKLESKIIKLLDGQLVNGLYKATAKDSDDDLRDVAKDKVRSLGFGGWLICESEWSGKPVAVEIWETSLITKY